jgi:hypothetical protein
VPAIAGRGIIGIHRRRGVLGLEIQRRVLEHMRRLARRCNRSQIAVGVIGIGNCPSIGQGLLGDPPRQVILEGEIAPERIGQAPDIALGVVANEGGAGLSPAALGTIFKRPRGS